MKNRIIWADSIKGWLMVLVIIGHAIQSVMVDGFSSDHIWNLIYSFHMPAFMAVSGWLSYRKAESTRILNDDVSVFLNYCNRRAQQILVPFFVWSLIAFFHSGNYSFENLSKIILYPDAYLWFLWVLFWICVLFKFAQFIAVKLRINDIIIIWGFCFILLLLMVLAEIRICGFQFIAYYFLFYSIGYGLHKYNFKILSYWLTLVVLGVVWFLLAWGWNMHELPSWFPVIPKISNTLLQYLYRGITALVAIIFILEVSPKFFNGTDRLNSFMAKTGIISLGMYTGHLVFLGHIKDGLIYLYLGMNVWLTIILTSVLAFIVAYILVRLLEKNTYTARVFLGKI